MALNFSRGKNANKQASKKEIKIVYFSFSTDGFFILAFLRDRKTERTNERKDERMNKRKKDRQKDKDRQTGKQTDRLTD